MEKFGLFELLLANVALESLVDAVYVGTKQKGQLPKGKQSEFVTVQVMEKPWTVVNVELIR